MFTSRDTLRVQDRTHEVEMESFVGRYLEETQLTYEEIEDLFAEAFPNDTHRFQELVEDWMA